MYAAYHTYDAYAPLFLNYSRIEGLVEPKLHDIRASEEFLLHNFVTSQDTHTHTYICLYI